MQKLAIAMALAAAVAIPSALSSSPAQADGGYHRHHHYWHHWRHPHVWGDGDYEIIRWANGDCKIWHDDNGPPWGTDWVVLAEDFPTWDAAWAGLVWLQQHRRACL
jgi:hypothetical protein